MPPDFPIACVDPKTCADPYLNPKHMRKMHALFVRKANEVLAPRRKSFETIDDEYSHFYGTIIRYITRQPEFFESRFIINADGASFNKGLLILGDHGVGKSFVFHVLSMLNTETRKYGNSFSFMSALEVVEMFNLHGTAGIQNLFRGQRYFDDVGTEDVGQHYGKSEVFKILIERRHELFLRSGHKTFITSNLSRDQFATIYGSRIESRLYEMFNIIYAGGPDRRKQ